MSGVQKNEDKIGQNIDKKIEEPYEGVGQKARELGRGEKKRGGISLHLRKPSVRGLESHDSHQ